MKARLSNVLAIGAIVGATALSAVVGSMITGRSRRVWYRLLRKSDANPPDRLFGPVWTVLYSLSATAASRIYLANPSPARRTALSLWGLQQLLNAAWSPLFFGKHRSRAALVDVCVLWLVLTALIRHTRLVDRFAARLLLPYLAWVTFAMYLNYAVVKKNPHWLSS